MGKSPFTIKVKGKYTHTLRFLTKLRNGEVYNILERYAQIGIDSLRDYTPVDTGDTRNSWYYDIRINDDKASITWLNSCIEGGQNVVILLEYGHGTRHGGWVEGIDIVDPAIEPIFIELKNKIWKEMIR